MSQILTYTFEWRGISCRVTEIRDHKIAGWTRLEVEVVSPKGAPLPITDTGSLIHEIDADALTAAGGALAFIAGWCDREAPTKRFANAEFRWRQRSLF